MKKYSTIFLRIAVIIIGIPVLAAVLQRLLQDDIDIKSENDLTV